MTPLRAAYALLFALTACVHALSRRSAPARMASSAPRERRSSLALGLAHAASMVAGALFSWLGVGDLALSGAVAWAAVAAMVLGFGLQIWAMLTLGPLFTLSLQAADAQPIVERGPYRLVRHPGYLGQIIFWLAFAVASRNAVTMAVVIVADAIGYGLRIQTEEEMLRAAVGERYSTYAERRARLVPGVW